MAKLCQGTTKAGTPCKSRPLTGSDYCRQHQVIERVEEVEEPEPVVESTPFVCGHQNMHYTGDKPMLCDMEPGHEGAHGADFLAIDYRDGGKTEEWRRTHWSDAAGTPADQIEPDYEALAKLIVERQIRQEAEKLKARA